MKKRALPISIFIGFAGFTYSSILSYLTSFAKEMDLMDAASFFLCRFCCFPFGVPVRLQEGCLM
ncbi:hypothetical protein RCO48_12175 [Peribacillus frigoritolerans]|nr:hypothetical protein [Peribacillus frigoritolerans]